MNMQQQDLTEHHFQKSCSTYKMLTNPAEIKDVLRGISEAALDFETTSLSPWDGDIRITSVCNDDTHFLIDHEYAGPFEKYVEHMLDGTWYVYNAKFECRWADQYLYERCGIPEALRILDVDFMAKSVIGGHPSSLAKMAKRDLGVTMSKDEQNSGWANLQLSKGQYDYAAFDSYVTWAIKDKWQAEMNADHWRGFHIFNDAVRGTVECECTGLPLDVRYHRGQMWAWTIKRDTHAVYLRRYAKQDSLKNLQSRPQVGNWIKKNFPPEIVDVWPKTEKRGDLKLDRDFMKSVGKVATYPINRWTAAYIGYTYYEKYLSTYGQTLIDNFKTNGAVLSRFNIAQARTGRYSSSSTNLQNIPRKVAVRKAFKIPDGSSQRLILADYKGVEIRVLAELSGDKQLIHDAIYSDVHAGSASAIYHEDIDTILAALNNEGTKDYYHWKGRRSIAKGFTFQLTYGAQALALSFVLGCSIEEAQDAITKWAARYENAYNYRFKMFDYMTDSGGYLPIKSGRRVYVPRDDRTYPVAANYPIQGAAADVMYRAVYHTHRLFDKHKSAARLCATVHDEVISICHREEAEEALQLQVEAMAMAWNDVFPGTNLDNMTDHCIGMSWADKP